MQRSPNISVILTILSVCLLLLQTAALPAYGQPVVKSTDVNGFSDLSDHWAAPMVLPLAISGIVKGFPDGTFRPDITANRLETTIIFSRALNMPARTEELPFSDADLIPVWARGAVAAATPLLAGVPDSQGRVRFLPFDQLTRAQLAVMAHRSLQLLGYQPPVPTTGGAIAHFRDQSQVPGWAQVAFNVVVAAGVMHGDGSGRLLPLRVATRAEVSAVVLRLLQVANPDRLLSPVSPPQPADNGGAQSPSVAEEDKPSLEHSGGRVIAYYGRSWSDDRRGLTAIRDNGHIIDVVAETGFFIDWSGRVQGEPHQELRQQVRAQGISLLAVISNDAGKGFDRSLAHHILTSDGVAEKAVQSIVDFLVRHGYDGLNLDFENIPPSDRWALNALVGRLAASLKAKGLIFTVAVPAKTIDDPLHQWGGAFDYVTLGNLADALVVMGYDEHWLGGAPGPVASLPWVTAVMDYALQTTTPEKIWWGIPAYGYEWSSDGQSRAFPGKDGLARAVGVGVTVHWDDLAQVPYFVYYGNGSRTIAYYENAHSLRAKLAAVTARGLGGVALWRLGYEDPEVWPLLERYRLGQPLNLQPLN